MIRILFVCTGNTCRSPMAEAMLRHMAEERGIELDVKSAGVFAWDGAPMSQHAATILEEKNITNHQQFRSSVLNEERVYWADVILTLTIGHKQYVIQQFPSASCRTFTLKEYASDCKLNCEHNGQLQQLEAELQLKSAMGQAPTEEELSQLIILQQHIPNMDIVDPYGGSLEQYRMTVEEIQAAITNLLDKLEQSDRGTGSVGNVITDP